MCREVDILVKVQTPTADEVSLLQKDKTLISFLDPGQSETLLNSINAKGSNVLAMDMVPRISASKSAPRSSAGAVSRCCKYFSHSPLKRSKTSGFVTSRISANSLRTYWSPSERMFGGSFVRCARSIWRRSCRMAWIWCGADVYDASRSQTY